MVEPRYEPEKWQDVDFVQRVLRESAVASYSNVTVTAVTVTGWGDSGGFSGDMFKVKVTIGSQDTTFVLKTQKDVTRSIASGSAREAIYLGAAKEVTPLLVADGLVPNVIYASGSMETGLKVTLMEMVDGVQSGYFFGQFSPINWGKDLTALTAPISDMTEAGVVDRVVSLAAKLHSAWWTHPDLKTDKFSFLRGQGWIRGAGQESWESTMKLASSAWEKTRPTTDTSDTIKWNPKVVALMNAAFDRVSWEEFQKELKSIPFTLVHGDFHPGNIGQYSLRFDI